jgi:hypothetical protein
LTIAPVALAPPGWRALAYSAAIAFGVSSQHRGSLWAGTSSLAQFFRRIYVSDYLADVRFDLWMTKQWIRCSRVFNLLPNGYRHTAEALISMRILTRLFIATACTLLSA